MPSNLENSKELKSGRAIERPRKNNTNSNYDKNTYGGEKPKSKPTESSDKQLEKATNSQGIAFEAGDLIKVQVYHGINTTAYIKYFYSTSTGMMVVYAPAEEMESPWTWEQGICSIESTELA